MINQDQLFKELNIFLMKNNSDIYIKDEYDDKNRRYHFKNDCFLLLSFSEENFNVREIKKVLVLYYKNYSTSPSKYFTDNYIEIYDRIFPFLHSKDRQRKIKKILDYEI